MKDLFAMLRRFVPPYKKYVVLNIVCNILASVLTLFSFAVIIPILEMLFKVKEATYEYMPLDKMSDIGDVAINNFYYFTQKAIEVFGPVRTLGILAVLLVVMTGLKVGVTYLSSYFIIPMRNGIVRDIRNYVFDKMVILPDRKSVV